MFEIAGIFTSNLWKVCMFWGRGGYGVAGGWGRLTAEDGEGQGVLSLSHLGCVSLEAWDPVRGICLSLSVAHVFSVLGEGT